MRVSEENNSFVSRTALHLVVTGSRRSSFKSGTLMDPGEDIKSAIGWCRFNLRLIGIWPDPTKTEDGWFLRNFYLVPLVFVIFSLSAPQMVNLVFIWGDIDLMTENLATANMPVVSTLSQIVAVRYYKNALRPIIGLFAEDWRRDKTSQERSVMLDYAIKARQLTIFGTVLIYFMVTLFIVMRLMTLITLPDRHSINQDHLPIYPAYFPFDLTSSPILELIWAAQIIAAYCATISFAGVDGCIVTLVFHTCGQLVNLCNALETVFDGNNLKDPAEVQARLSNIVKRHQHLNWYVAKLEEYFNVNLLVQMLVCTIQLCFQFLQVYQFVTTKSEDEESIVIRMLFFITFVSFYILHIYIYCYLGEMLLVQSSEIGQSAYQSKWFNATAKEARYVFLIMCRSISPLRLTAGKFSTFSLQTFSTILKTSFGYLSVLLTVTSVSE